MKVAIQCDSPLLQRSLELFLAEHLSSIRQCDILIRDKEIRDERHPTFVIGSSEETSDLIKPFTKAQLMYALTQKFTALRHVPDTSEREEEVDEGERETVGLEILERRIEKLTREYQENIIKAVRAFYEQK
ncbi:MAG: hypothetical protein AB7S65_12685 [Sulfuricurvum sp.]